MMGPTKLSEIKRQLQQAARENAKELKVWIKQQRTHRKNSRHSRVFQELVWLEHLLREGAAEKKVPPPQIEEACQESRETALTADRASKNA